MTHLLIHVPDSADGASSDTKFGGRPSAPANTITWSVCSSCVGNMQFLGQIQREAEQDKRTELLLLFMCQNDPGICSEWDANSGGNKILPVAAKNLGLVAPPAAGETTRSSRYGAKIVQQTEADYEIAQSTWSSANAVSPRKVLGQLGGNPSWIQGEEIPVCDSCGNPMQFVAQLEQGPDWKTEMNFGGGGCAYVFQCSCPSRSAKMLWQC